MSSVQEKASTAGPRRLVPEAMPVSSSSIALLAGVSRSTVSSWRNPARKRGFPEPTGGTAGRPLFTLLPVAKWLAKNGYWDRSRFLKRIPGVVLSQLSESLEISPGARNATGMQLLETACLAKMALLSGYRLPRATDRAEEIRILGPLRSAGRAAAATRPEWAILIGAAEDGTGPGMSDPARLSDDVSELVQYANLMLVWAASASPNAVDLIGRRIVAEFFQPRVTYPIMVGGQRYWDASWSEAYHDVAWGTPQGPGKAVRDAAGDAHAAVLLARRSGQSTSGQADKDRGPLTVVDPCAGIGSVLLSMADTVGRDAACHPSSGPAMRFVGFESDAHLLLVARRRAFLADLQIEFHHADLLAEDRMAGQDADLIFALTPPSSDSGVAEAAGYNYEANIKPHDSRWIYGIPKGELAWIMHAITHLTPGGRAVVRTPSEMTRTEGNSRVLKGLVGDGWVERLSLDAGGDLWTLSQEPDRKAVQVGHGHRSGANRGATSTEIQTNWLMQHWSTDLHELLIDQMERDPQQLWNQLHDAADRVTGSAESLTFALNLVEGNVTWMEHLAGRTGNTLSLGELAKTGYLEIVSPKEWRPASGTDDESGTAVEMRDTDVVVQLDDGIRAERWKSSITWTPKSFVLRVRNVEELNPGYLACALAGSWNERIRSDQGKPRLVDRLKAFEIPMLTPSVQAESEDAILYLQLLHNHAQELASRSESLETSFLNAIRYGAAPTPNNTHINEEGNADA